MIKGVNKQIIEIKCTNNEYFDRALLFVNSCCDMFSENDTRVMAEEYMEKLSEEFHGDVNHVEHHSCKDTAVLIRILMGLIVLSAAVILLFALG